MNECYECVVQHLEEKASFLTLKCKQIISKNHS